MSEWFKMIRDKLREDSELAHVWHDNIAVPIQDEGVPHDVANRAASRIMAHLFGVTTERPTASPWTTESPTEPETFMWWREHASSRAYPVEISNVPRIDGLAMFHPHENCWLPVAFVSGQWCPVQEPPA